MVLHAKLKELEQVILQIRDLATEVKDDIPEELNNAESIHGILRESVPDNRIVEVFREKEELENKVKEMELRIQALSQENAELAARVVVLRNEVIELRGMVRVVCRIRPSESSLQSVKCSDRSVEVEGKKFVVDKAFPPATTQEEVYQEFASLIESVLEGYRVCVFAYGQTGSGKTHTMTGSASDKGIIFRASRSIAGGVRKLIDEGYTVEYAIHCIEIYNDTIKDLIGNKVVQIQDDGGCLRLKNCEILRSDNLDSIEELLSEVSQKRTVGETCSNKQSSRSHSIVVIKVKLRNEYHMREGSLVLVDLAGSERLSESKAENERLKETQHINKSLSSLSNVFTALKRGDKHVPFRDSKLTRFLREYLTGKSRIAMIVNINPANISETLCSMRFASKVSECALGTAETNVHVVS